MELTIKLEKYLDDDEIREIAKDTVSSIFYKQIRLITDVERFISNICYRSFFAKLCEVMNKKPEDINNLITKKLQELLDDEYTYRHEIFAREDEPYYYSKPSPAKKILDEVLSQSRPQIERKVNELIDKYPFEELKDEICVTIYDCIEQKLFKSKEGE